jgi:dihydrofolate synthase/folylpolyglutamate synthase
MYHRPVQTAEIPIAAITDPEAGYRWMESFTNLETIQASKDRQLYRLDRMLYLLARFGDPHLCCPAVHVAGSKGKGSTATLMARALGVRARVGLYMSPHVSSYDERVTVDGAPAPRDLLLKQMNAIYAQVRSIPPQALPVSPTPTTFELLTLLAFLVFREMHCDFVVAEVGIGGRLDATNVLRPVVCVITPVELEHTDILGATLQEIAAEKAGIIKPGVPVCSAAQTPPVRQVIERIAGERGAPIVFADDAARITEVTVDRGGTSLRAVVEDEPVAYSLPMPGRFQADNAVLATLALRRLARAPDAADIRTGFERAVLPGRMELMWAPAGNPVVLDGAHTPVSVERAAEAFRCMFQGGGILIFGCVVGKRTESMVEVLAPQFPHVVVSRPNEFKESRPEEVHRIFVRYGVTCTLEPDPERALDAACRAAGARGAVFVTGSFYMVSEIRRLLRTRESISAAGSGS